MAESVEVTLARIEGQLALLNERIQTGDKQGEQLIKLVEGRISTLEERQKTTDLNLKEVKESLQYSRRILLTSFAFPVVVAVVVAIVLGAR